MKSPPRQFTDDVARLKTEEFIAGAVESPCHSEMA
jgi:hypothetical protein